MTDKKSSLIVDSCLPFQIEGQDIKGRIIRLNDTVDNVLNTHNYPDHISRLLGQVMAFTALIGSMMKYEGILTTQLKGEGPLRLLVSDFMKNTESENGIVRGHASFDETIPENAPLTALFGDKSYMAITKDQGKYMDRYQGIVSLEEQNFTAVAEEYFQSSEQLPTKLILTCDKGTNGKWQAAAIMIQHYARSSKHEISREENVTEDEWNTASILLNTIKQDELLDIGLSLQDILIRLFHQSGIRIFDHTHLQTGCRCSADKLRAVLVSLDMEELKDIAEDGFITATCEFCMHNHKFEIAKLMH
jgi:molecular chaperone Hsp33